MNKRNTVQRTMVLNTVRTMYTHPTAEEIYYTVLPLCPGISRGTVYRNLNELSEGGFIQRVAVTNAPDRFDFNTCEHFHCRCVKCGKVFDYKFSRAPLFDKESNDGFEVRNCDIIINGICKNCRE